MKEELEEIHQPLWIGQSCKDVLGRTITSNTCISCLQTLEMAKDIYQLIQMNKSEKLEYCQATLKKHRNSNRCNNLQTGGESRKTRK